MSDLLAKYFGPLTWAYCIIVGLIMLTPKGPVPISTLLGVVGIALGAYGFMTQAKSRKAG